MKNAIIPVQKYTLGDLSFLLPVPGTVFPEPLAYTLTGEGEFTPGLAICTCDAEEEIDYDWDEEPYCSGIAKTYTYYPVFFDPVTGEEYRFLIQGETDLTETCREYIRTVRLSGTGARHAKRRREAEHEVLKQFPETIGRVLFFPERVSGERPVYTDMDNVSFPEYIVNMLPEISGV